MDVVATADGHYIVGHPSKLSDAARLASTSAIHLLENRSLPELRALGADSERFPELSTFAWKLGNIIQKHQNMTHRVAMRSANGSHHYPLDRFVLALELKGALASDDIKSDGIISSVRRLLPQMPPLIMWHTAK